MHKRPLLAALAALVALGSMGYGYRAGAVPLPATPHLDALVDAGGYRLHLDCQGVGTPTLVLDAGLGADSRAWSRIQPALARLTRTCSYGRAGLGHSDAGPLPRTSAQILHELRTVLRRSRVAGPYILVGDGFGALTMQLYAFEHPAEVAGLVVLEEAPGVRAPASPGKGTAATPRAAAHHPSAATVTPTSTATPTDAPTSPATLTPTPTPSITDSPTITATASPSATPTASPTATPTPSPTASATASPGPSTPAGSCPPPFVNGTPPPAGTPFAVGTPFANGTPVGIGLFPPPSGTPGGLGLFGSGTPVTQCRLSAPGTPPPGFGTLPPSAGAGLPGSPRAGAARSLRAASAVVAEVQHGPAAGSAASTAAAEAASLPQSRAEVLAARHILGALPLIVLSAGQPRSGTAASAGPAQGVDLLRLSTNSKGLRLATTGAGGDLPRDQPGAVIDAARRVLDAVRRHQRLAR